MKAQDLLKRITSQTAPTIVDVRSGGEFQDGHIPGSIHAPAWKIPLRLTEIPADKDAELVVICEHGPRAQMAKSLLETLGYRNVDLLDGHMSAWRRSGHPQEK